MPPASRFESMPQRSLPRLIRDEFKGYTAGKFRQDLPAGPTGAMSAVLIILAQKYGLPGVWVAGDCWT